MLLRRPLGLGSVLAVHAADARDASADLYGVLDGYLYRVGEGWCERVPMTHAREVLGADWTAAKLADEDSPHPWAAFAGHSVVELLK